MTRIVRITASTMLLFCCSWFPAWAQDYVVMASNSPRYTDGALLKSGEVIVLAANQKVLLLDNSGMTRKITGPFSEKLKAGRKTTLSVTKVLSRIVKYRKSEGRSIGVMRGYWQDNLPPKQILDVTRNPVECLSRKRSQKIELRSSIPFTRAKLWREGSVDRAQIRWQNVNQSVPWPAAVELGNGGRFFILPDKSQSAYVVKIALLPKSFASLAHEAVWLWQNGCRQHARSVVDLISSFGCK